MTVELNVTFVGVATANDKPRVAADSFVLTTE